MEKKSKKATILVENLVFIILNLLFITILILFLLKQGGGAIVLEQSYAKQIALIIDSAKPGMIIKLNMQDALELADENGVDIKDIVKISNKDNLVTVKLNRESGYSYHYFNDVYIPFSRYVEEEKMFVMIIKDKIENE